MSRLIDADELLTSKWWDGMTNAFDKARAKIIIQSAKTVDAVQVVRCKDCKHWRNEDDSPTGLGNCDIEEDDFTLWRWDCDFCSYGERKDNG